MYHVLEMIELILICHLEVAMTVSDLIAKHVLKHTDPDYIKHSWLDRGSDEETILFTRN